MNPRTRNSILAVAGLVILAVTVGLGARAFLATLAPKVATSGATLIGGPFTLVDQDGKPRGDAEFRGKLMLVYFGYIYCPDVCPTELQTMGDAIDRLGAKADSVQPIFITIDPQRDTSAALKDYVSHFHPRLIGLTGSEAQVAAAAKAYRVYYAKAPTGSGSDDYLMDHTGLVYLMDAQGKYVTHFTPQTTPEQMAAAIAKHL